jgi:23S rRNA pseudouridine955/2504/2580 synthase
MMKDLGEKPAPGLASPQVRHFIIDEHSAGQRVDNFVLRMAKGVPKSHIYRVIRAGEVRVNRRRVEVDYRLVTGDDVRVPPLRMSAPKAVVARAAEFPVVFEDDALLVVNKPAGVAVHGGSGVSYGVIEQLRASRPTARFLELAHRLDRETSGVLVLAKKRSSLTALHGQMRGTGMDKRYLALAIGKLGNRRQSVRVPLERYLLADGERRVRPNPEGMAAHTNFVLLKAFADFSLVEAQLKTGRTHQIRVHLAHLHHPIAGDDKYGDFALNRELARRPARQALGRMFLHAASLSLDHPASAERMTFTAPLPEELETFLTTLK